MINANDYLSEVSLQIEKIRLSCYLRVFVFEPSFFVGPLPFFETLLYRKILWDQRFVLFESNQLLFFLLHQYLLMSSSCDMPTCNNSMSKVALSDTLYAAWMNFVCFTYPITYEKFTNSRNSEFSITKRSSMSWVRIPTFFNSSRLILLKSILNFST